MTTVVIGGDHYALQGYASSYATAHATCTSDPSITAQNNGTVGQQLDSPIPAYWCWRVLLRFNAAGVIPAGAVVTRVRMRLRVDWALYYGQDQSSTDFDLQISQYNWSVNGLDTQAHVEACYDGALAANTDFVLRNTAGIVDAVDYDGPDMSTAWVNASGDTYYSVRSSRDKSNTAPTAGGGYNELIFGAHFDLVIDYENSEFPGASWPDHLNSTVGPFPYDRPHAIVSQLVTDTESSFGRTGSGVTSIIGQGINFDSSTVITGARFRLAKVGNPQGNIVVELRNTQGGYPGPTLYRSATIPLAQVTATPKWFAVTFSSPYTMAPSTQYQLALSSSSNGPTVSDYFTVSTTNTNPYVYGLMSHYSTVSGWTGGGDMAFEVLNDATDPELYAMLADKTNNNIEVWKSTDGGSSWAEADAAHNSTVWTWSSTIKTGGKTLSAFKSGSKLYYATVDTNSGVDYIGVGMFDCATDLWDVTPNRYTTATYNANVSLTCPVHLAVRSDGVLVILYNGATERVSGTDYRRIRYATYNYGTNTWATNLDPADAQAGAAAHFDARAIALGYGDSVLMFWTQSNSTVLSTRHLLSNSTLWPATYNMIHNTESGNLGAYDVGLPSADFLLGGQFHLVAVPVARETVSTSGFVYSFSGDEAENAGTLFNDSAAGELASSNPSAAVVAGTKLYCFFVRDSDQHVYYGVWDIPTYSSTSGDNAFITDASVGGISAGYLSGQGQIGVLYKGDGLVRFRSLSLSTAATLAIPAATGRIDPRAPAFAGTVNPPALQAAQVGTTIVLTW